MTNFLNSTKLKDMIEIRRGSKDFYQMKRSIPVSQVVASLLLSVLSKIFFV